MTIGSVCLSGLFLYVFELFIVFSDSLGESCERADMYEMLSFREGTLKLHLELTHFVSFYYSLFLLKIDTSLIWYILTRVSISSPPSSSHLYSLRDLLFFHFLFRKKADIQETTDIRNKTRYHWGKKKTFISRLDKAQGQNSAEWHKSFIIYFLNLVKRILFDCCLKE